MNTTHMFETILGERKERTTFPPRSFFLIDRIHYVDFIPYISHFIHNRAFPLFQTYNFDPTKLPPSNAIVAPLTNAPALLLRNKQAPATSSGLPILPNGIPATIVSPKVFNVAAIILLSNGPHASALLVMFLLPKWFASTLLN
jgi:hypothetical protein